MRLLLTIIVVVTTMVISESIGSLPIAFLLGGWSVLIAFILNND